MEKFMIQSMQWMSLILFLTYTATSSAVWFRFSDSVCEQQLQRQHVVTKISEVWDVNQNTKLEEWLFIKAKVSRYLKSHRASTERRLIQKWRKKLRGSGVTVTEVALGPDGFYVKVGGSASCLLSAICRDFFQSN
jgi:hypothetical protein